MESSQPAIWTCGKCGRRVPQRIDACRCGATREDAVVQVSEPATRTQPSPAGISALGFAVRIVLAVVVFGGVGAAWYGWTRNSVNERNAEMAKTAAAISRRMHPEPQQVQVKPDDAGSRVARYLTMQLLVNVSFGLCVAFGLYFIGVPNAALWGAFAAIMRFVPYIGVWIAAAVPVLLSFAVSTSWLSPILTIALFITEVASPTVRQPHRIIAQPFSERLANGRGIGAKVRAIGVAVGNDLAVFGYVE